MKLKYEMEILDIDGSPMAVPIDSEEDFRGVLHMNGTAQDILEMLKQDITEEEIVSAMYQEYDATEEQLRSNVRRILDILRENHLLVE